MTDFLLRYWAPSGRSSIPAKINIFSSWMLSRQDLLPPSSLKSACMMSEEMSHSRRMSTPSTSLYFTQPRVFWAKNKKDLFANKLSAAKHQGTNPPFPPTGNHDILFFFYNLQLSFILTPQIPEQLRPSANSLAPLMMDALARRSKSQHP